MKSYPGMQMLGKYDILAELFYNFTKSWNVYS